MCQKTKTSLCSSMKLWSQWHNFFFHFVLSIWNQLNEPLFPFIRSPRDFLLCLERVRTLTWLLLGATMHTALTRDTTGLTCRPLPFTFVNSVADHVKYLISGFPDQQKVSLLMSAFYSEMGTVYRIPKITIFWLSANHLLNTPNRIIFAAPGLRCLLSATISLTLLLPCLRVLFCEPTYIVEFWSPLS